MRVWGKIAVSVVIGLLLWWLFATACFTVIILTAADEIPADLGEVYEVVPSLIFWGTLMAVAFGWVGAPAFIGLVALVLVIPDIRAARRHTQQPDWGTYPPPGAPHGWR